MEGKRHFSCQDAVLSKEIDALQIGDERTGIEAEH
jgi:hypothetical protein